MRVENYSLEVGYHDNGTVAYRMFKIDDKLHNSYGPAYE